MIVHFKCDAKEDTEYMLVKHIEFNRYTKSNQAEVIFFEERGGGPKFIHIYWTREEWMVIERSIKGMKEIKRENKCLQNKKQNS